jgi:hypothetical protein
MSLLYDTRRLLEQEGAGVEVKNPEAFVERAPFFLNHQEELREGGLRAKAAVLAGRGASRRHAEVIARLMRERVSRFLCLVAAKGLR